MQDDAVEKLSNLGYVIGSLRDEIVKLRETIEKLIAKLDRPDDHNRNRP